MAKEEESQDILQKMVVAIRKNSARLKSYTPDHGSSVAKFAVVDPVFT